MHFGKWITCLAGIAVLGASAATVQGQSAVRFVGIDDAVPSRFFDPATSQATGNKLVIGFNTGRDPATWKLNDFMASTAANRHLSAMDTISFTVEAPPGYYITKITYTQKGTGSVSRTGKASGSATWVVGNFAYQLGTFTTNPNLSKSLDLRQQRWTSVPVSITPALFVSSTPTSGAASVSITSAQVVVEVAPK